MTWFRMIAGALWPEKATYRLALAVAQCVFFLDQGTKFLVEHAYSVSTIGYVEVWPILNFVFALNKGINFGLGASDSAIQPYVLAAVTSAAAIALLYWSARTSRPYVPLGCGLVAGGAVGNAIDRLLYGGVFDFINFDCCGINNLYAFNIADVAIFFGAILIAWFAWSPDEPKASPGIDH